MTKDQTKITYREIMRRKFYERGLTLKDYKPQEILETILCDCITKHEKIPSIAEGLLLHFCSVKRVLSADRQMLENTKLLDDSEITKLKIISEACREIRLSKFSFPLDITDKQTLNDFLEAVFDFTLNEKIFILLLDDKNGIISIKAINEGSSNNVFVTFETIKEHIIDRKFKRFILAHNHPYATSMPSDSDLYTTERIKNDASEQGFELVAHYVVAYDGIKEVSLH